MARKLYKLSQIKDIVNEINKDIDVVESELPNYGFGIDSKHNYIKINKDGYLLFEFDPYHNKDNQHLIIKTLDINELLFEIFKSATRSMANKFELDNRIENQDPRILFFRKHIEILNSLPLEKEYVDKLNDYYHYLLRLKKPIDIPEW
jgi:hypothetical protein